jgi:hypothetical protein
MATCCRNNNGRQHCYSICIIISALQSTWLKAVTEIHWTTSYHTAVGFNWGLSSFEIKIPRMHRQHMASINILLLLLWYHQPPVQWVPGSFPRGVTLTTHPHLVPRSWMSRCYTSSHPQAPSWRVAGLLYFTFTVVPQPVSDLDRLHCAPPSAFRPAGIALVS